MRSTKRFFTFGTMILLTVIFILPRQAMAIPTFSRKYGTSCSTCHFAYPKLNGFGKAFKNNGYRYPSGQDPEMTKEEPVSLGSEGYKRVFPDAIWPADIAGGAPFSVHAFGRIHYNSDDKLSFEIPHEFELLYGGTIGETISYFGEVELEHESELAYEFAVQYDFNPLLHVKLGSVGLNATPEQGRLTREHYNMVDLKNQSGTWRMRNGAGGGLEVWGAGNGGSGSGGFTYALGMGNGQNDAGNYDVNPAKDFYGRVTYKLGGLGETGGTEGQEASDVSAFYIDNNIRVGGFFCRGNATDTLDVDDVFTVMGGDIDWWFNRLVITAGAMMMKSDYNGSVRNSLAYFAEGHYVVHPWLIGYARFESTTKDVDDTVADPQLNLIPSVIIMLRANVKLSLEYRLPLDEARKDNGRFTLQFNIGI